jgi:hypothetical protein
VIRESYNRIGMQVDTVVAPGTPAANIVRSGVDSAVLIDPPAAVAALRVTYADESTIGTAFPALANIIRVFYVPGLNSGIRGETWDAGSVVAGDSRLNASFIDASLSPTGPYSPAHEMGHSLWNKQAHAGHFMTPAAPVGNRLFANQNLMLGGTTPAEAVNASKRLWDANDADGINEYTAMRGSVLTRNY